MDEYVLLSKDTKAFCHTLCTKNDGFEINRINVSRYNYLFWILHRKYIKIAKQLMLCLHAYQIYQDMHLIRIETRAQLRSEFDMFTM